MQVTLHGIYDRVIDRDELSGFTIFKLKVQHPIEGVKMDARKRITVKAERLPYYVLGFPLEVTGDYVEDDHGYGPTILSSFVKERSMDDVIMSEYLVQICHGIGPATAQKIITTSGYGADVFGLSCAPDAIAILKKAGVHKALAEELIGNIKKTVGERKLLEWFQDYQVDYASVVKLYDLYGDNAVGVIKENPYRIGQMIGLSFDKMDQIAKKHEGNALRFERIEQAVKLALGKNERQGHTYGFQADIVSETQALLKTASFPQRIPATTITNCIHRSKCFVKKVGKESRLFLRKTYREEINIAKQLKRLIHAGERTSFYPELVDEVAKETGMQYAFQQKKAFELLMTTGVKILTGGPGTGKTTTVLGLITAFLKLYPNKNNIKLCAPTGRAAQRVSESTNMEAVTVHRLVEYKPYGDGEAVMKDANDPIEADFILVDEMSMADTQLMSMFLSAVKSGTMVIFVGDVNQLPSVGAGDVLHDMIYSGKLEVCQLTEVYRQAADSPIVQNANKVNFGETDLSYGADYQLVSCVNQKQMLQETLKKVKEYHREDDKYYTQILAPVHKATAGVANINQMLQEEMNAGNKQLSLRFGKRRFYLHDKILLLENNYNVGYFNGDIGEVISIDGGVLKVNVRNETFIITRDLVKHLDLSYCMTIHKSQGSEYPVVILILPKCKMLQRNLYYTAVTRAKQKVIVIEEEGASVTAISKNVAGKRKTMLMEQIMCELK